MKVQGCIGALIKRLRLGVHGSRLVFWNPAEQYCCISVQAPYTRDFRGRLIVNPRKLEHRFRMIHAGIPFSLL